MIEIKLKFTAKAFKTLNRALGVQFLSSSGGILYQFAKKVIIAIDDSETEVQLGIHEKDEK